MREPRDSASNDAVQQWVASGPRSGNPFLLLPADHLRFEAWALTERVRQIDLALADAALDPDRREQLLGQRAYLGLQLQQARQALQHWKQLARPGHEPPWPGDLARDRQRFQAIKARLDLTQVIEALTDATFARTGRDRLVARCPLPGHADRTPSFTVWSAPQRFHCFGCQRHGDVIDFVRELHLNDDWTSLDALVALEEHFPEGSSPL
jgi:CHC2-type zinc finger protein